MQAALVIQDPNPLRWVRQTALTLPRNDNYETYLRVGALKNFMKLTGDSLQFWKDLYAHPNLDDWWKARNPCNFVGDIKPAMLTVGGLFDAEDCFGAWRMYMRLSRKRIRLLLSINW